MCCSVSRQSSRKRDSEEADLAASIREASKLQVVVSNRQLNAAKKLHLESRLLQLRDNKRNELRLSGNPLVKLEFSVVHSI
jgi:hypothetical protein